MSDHRDSAGNVRTDEQVQELARTTARQMTDWELLDGWKEGVGGWDLLPAYMTRCDCHGLWYDECEAYK